jgi:hypothetical protein
MKRITLNHVILDVIDLDNQIYRQIQHQTMPKIRDYIHDQILYSISDVTILIKDRFMVQLPHSR